MLTSTSALERTAFWWQHSQSFKDVVPALGGKQMPTHAEKVLVGMITVAGVSYAVFAVPDESAAGQNEEPAEPPSRDTE